MSVSATEPVGAVGLGLLVPSTSAPSSDKEMFLNLMVAQLRYQDPMNPADSGEFLAQSAQFNALEKMQDVADRTTTLLGVQLAFGASSLVGRHVAYTLADGTVGQGQVSGVDFAAEGPVLDVDGVAVPISQVQTVTDGSAVAAPVVASPTADPAPTGTPPV
jgi:flagellar basal-body rod modification protein FlgD